MTQSELAQQLGISASMLSRLKKRGMPTDSLERAQRWRKRHLETSRIKGVRRDGGTEQAPAETAFFDVDDDDQPTAEGGGGAVAEQQFLNARNRKEHYQAELARLNFERASGLSVEAAAVDQFISEAGTMFRMELENMAPRLAPVLAHLTDEADIYKVISDDILRALTNLQHQFDRLAKLAAEQPIEQA